MASANRQNSNGNRNPGARGNSNAGGPNRNLGASNNSNDADTNSLSLSGSHEPMEANEVYQLSGSWKKLLASKTASQDVEIVCEIARQYKIQPNMANHLPELGNFETVVVVDDSGSMDTKVDGTERTRWNELCEIVKTVIEIVMKFNSRGIDIHFLNGGTFLKVKDPQHVNELFDRTPRGHTPLVHTLQKIFTSNLARRGRDKKLLVFVATDGEPTNEDCDPIVPELEYLMKETRDPETTYVSFLLCTDDPACVGYLREWDRTMKHVDVTDDYETEKREVRRCQQQEDYPFSHGDYIVKALVGAIIPSIDTLDG